MPLGTASERAFENLPGTPWFRELDRTVIESAGETTPDEIVARSDHQRDARRGSPRERERLLAEVRVMVGATASASALPQLTYTFAFARLS